MARTGYSSVWISRNQSSVLRRARRTTPRQGFGVTEPRNLPPGKWLLSGGHPRGAKRRYNHGIHTARRPDDGNAIWVHRSRDNDLLDATRWLHGTPTRRTAQHEIRVAGNLWNLGGHAANRGRDERGHAAGTAGL